VPLGLGLVLPPAPAPEAYLVHANTRMAGQKTVSRLLRINDFL
jgi:hypothetical protein